MNSNFVTALPVYNEAKTVNQVLDEVAKKVETWVSRVIAVNDRE